MDLLKISSYNKGSYISPTISYPRMSSPSSSISYPKVSYGVPSVSKKISSITPSYYSKAPSYISRKYNYKNYYPKGISYRGGGSSTGRGGGFVGGGGIISNNLRNRGLKTQTGWKKYNVFTRRFGLWKPIATGVTYKQAFNIGKFKTRTTLGASFKVTGKGVKQPKSIFGYRKKLSKKEGIVFIEEPKFRLSTPTEKSEIFSFRKLRTMKGGIL